MQTFNRAGRHKDLSSFRLQDSHCKVPCACEMTSRTTVPGRSRGGSPTSGGGGGNGGGPGGNGGGPRPGGPPASAPTTNESATDGSTAAKTESMMILTVLSVEYL